MTDSLIEIRREGAVATLVLNRPQVRNALNPALIAETAQAADALDRDPDVRVVVLTGAGPVFCAGMDLKEPIAGDLASLYRDGLGDREAIARMKKPVIAAVSGAAIGGGCELAMQADIIIADTTTRFGQPEVTRNGMPGVGGTQRLARLVGRMRAMELCLTGRMIEAEEALRIGLVVEVTKPENLATRAAEMAARIANATPAVAAMIKQSINSTDELGLSQGLQAERALCYAAIAMRHQQG